METALAKKTGEPDVAPGGVEGGADLGARIDTNPGALFEAG